MKTKYCTIPLVVLLLGVSTALFAQTGINTKKPYGVFHIDGASSVETTNPLHDKPTILQQSDDFIVLESGSVGVGTIEPHASAILELKSDKKGILIPKVTLQNATDIVTVKDPEKGLMIYNKKVTTGLQYEGFVYWDGQQWKTLANDVLAQPKVTTLHCNEAVLSPAVLKSGVPYVGYLTIPYSGGNGAKYEEGSPLSSFGNGGLVATLESGQLTRGNGKLTYKVVGTPNNDGGETGRAVFSLVFGEQHCVALVGESPSGNSGFKTEKLVYTGSQPNLNQVLTIGRFQFRYNTSSSSTSEWGPQIALVNSVSMGETYQISVDKRQGQGSSGIIFYTREVTLSSRNDFQFMGTSMGAGDVTGVFTYYVGDVAHKTLYKVTFYHAGNRGGVYAILAEQYY